MLQVGGVQDAVMADAPGWGVDTEQVVPLPQFVVPLPLPEPEVALPVEITAGCEEIQVSGGLGTMQPWTSTAVAAIVSDVPLLAIKLVWSVYWPFTLSSSAMHCTGQASKLKGWL
jgi:hypothetical protein